MTHDYLFSASLVPSFVNSTFKCVFDIEMAPAQFNDASSVNISCSRSERVALSFKSKRKCNFILYKHIENKGLSLTLPKKTFIAFTIMLA